MDQDHFDNFFRYCEEIINSSLSADNLDVNNHLNYGGFSESCVNVQIGRGADSENKPSTSGSDENKPSTSGVGENKPNTISDDENDDDDTEEYEHFNIIADIEKHTKRFNLMGRKITFALNDPPEDKNSVRWFYNSINSVLDYVLESVEPDDYVGFTFHTPRMENGPGWLSFRRADQMHLDVFWQAVEKILQSNRELLSDGQFVIELTKISMPVGKGGSFRGHGLSYAELCRRKYGLIHINNNDNLCLPRALVVADSFFKKDSCFKYIVKNTHGIQSERVRELMTKADVQIGNDGAGIPEIIKFQNYLTQYNICVYEFNGRGKVIFEGVKETNLPRLNLLYHQRHYSVIKSLTAAFSCKYFCEPCHVPYYVRGGHSCPNLCRFCKHTPPCIPILQLIKCDKCNRHFRGQICYNNHKSTVCKILKKCSRCLKIYLLKKQRIHKCGEVYCKFCEAYKNSGHLCYMLKDNTVLKAKSIYIYYDFETRQEKMVGDNYEHEVNLCVVQQSCSQCTDIEDIKQLCNTCGIREHVFATDPVEKFLSYVLLPRTSFSSVICIAHNAKAFDCQFILKYLVEVQNVKPTLILNGSKIMMMKINNIKFIDSSNYLPMALASLPKAMDLPSTIKKGYFPHFFNKIENQKYIGSLPSTKYYGVDSMSISTRQNFLDWYNKQIESNTVFNMSKELVEYCVSDVDILRRACEKFRKTFIQDCKVCPFTESVTIASACNRVFRRLFLKPDSIGIIPQRGYRQKDNQSKIALMWLIHQENTRGIRIQHAGNGSEVLINNIYKVDGYFHTDKLVFEFLGCFWHGCTLCFRTNRDKSIYNNTKETMNLRHERTLNKLNKIQDLGYTMIKIWECEFRKELENNKDLKRQLNNHELLNNLPLEPRDAFFGGRTGNTTLYRKTKKDEKIKYVDVCSLYPYVCKYGKYPIGHPKIFVGNECDTLCPNNNIDNVEGLIKCTVLPPNNLFHPVLPRKAHGKLMFVLCRKCCDDLEQDECEHTDIERQFIGTWVSDEVRRAVALGYKVLKIHEIWQYKITVYDRLTKNGGLFVEYINTFLKMKQEASGYPEGCNDDRSKSEYIKKYFEEEGIELDPTQIVKNSGKRSVAKLMLNSFWGKFAQTENRPQTSTVSNAAELYELLANPSVEVQRIIPAGDQMLYVTWVHNIEAMHQLSTVNVVIAAYTTAQARLRLHEFLEPLGQRALYYDTDSIIYIHSLGQYSPPTGNFLGDLTDELECYGPDSYITEFVCGGPKNYAYKVFSPSSNVTKEVCKVKGFTLNYANSKIINFDSMKNLIINPSQENLIVTANNIRSTVEHSVNTKKESKTFAVNFMKRRLVDNVNSDPYGFKKVRLS